MCQVSPDVLPLVNECSYEAHPQVLLEVVIPSEHDPLCPCGNTPRHSIYTPQQTCTFSDDRKRFKAADEAKPLN